MACVGGLPALAGVLLFLFPARAPDFGPAPERVPLWPDQAPAANGFPATTNAYLSVYRPRVPNGTVLVVCPGGGYSQLVLELEGHAVGRRLARKGLTVVVLEYRLPAGNPVIPLQDAQRAIRWARSRAGEWNCRTNRIGILGFSAGGHLAAMAATRFDDGDPSAADPVERTGSRPDFVLLLYPVISMGPLADAGSPKNLMGTHPAAETVEEYSCEKHVTAQTPPAFLVHAVDDIVVPSANSRLFHEALQAHGVSSEYLELPAGGHGLGYGGPLWDLWQSRALRWLAKL